jgi:hypothetical protein
MRFALHALEVLVVRSRSLLARRARIIPSAIATDSMERASLLTSSRTSGNVPVYRGAPIEEGPQILPDKMSSFEPGARPQRGQRCSRRRADPLRHAAQEPHQVRPCEDILWTVFNEIDPPRETAVHRRTFRPNSSLGNGSHFDGGQQAMLHNDIPE